VWNTVKYQQLGQHPYRWDAKSDIATMLHPLW
jgi:hypothetical protein